MPSDSERPRGLKLPGCPVPPLSANAGDTARRRASHVLLAVPKHHGVSGRTPRQRRSHDVGLVPDAAVEPRTAYGAETRQ